MNAHRPLLLLLGVVAFACGADNSGPGYYGYGYSCRGPLDCGPSTSCVEQQGGTCWPLCRSDIDCGPGYVCKSVSRHGAGGKDDVCVP